MGYVAKRRRRGKDGVVRVDARYTAFFRDKYGRLRSKAAFRDRAKSEALLRRCMMEAAEGRTDWTRPKVDHATRKLEDHVGDYLAHLKASGACDAHVGNTRTHLLSAFGAMRIRHPLDVTTGSVEVMVIRMVAPKAEGGADLAFKTRNHRLKALRAFYRWGKADGRWDMDPTARIRMLPEKADPTRRRRRPLTEPQLWQLVAAARERGAKLYRATAKTVRPSKLDRLRHAGDERATRYLAMALAGLRRGEARQLEWRDIDLKATPPTLTVRAEAAKAGKEDATIPLAPALAAGLEDWRAIWPQAERSLPVGRARVFPSRPGQWLREFYRDIEAAGIPRETPEGVLDLHALRHSFASWLVRAGVAPKTAQALLRHSDVRMTLAIYAHVHVGDRAAAVQALPRLDGAKAQRHKGRGGAAHE